MCNRASRELAKVELNSLLLPIEAMLRKLYLLILSALCSVSAFALDFSTMKGGGKSWYALPETPDTSSHRLFHSKFGDEVEFPRLTDDPKQNALILSRFFSEISRRKNTKIETFISLIPLVPKSGDTSAVETVDQMMPISYRCYYSASMEYILFYEMGGRNRTLGQIFNAFRNETNSTFTPLCHKNPDLYCAQLDSVAAFLKNLDYIGDIYPNIVDVKPRETQTATVERLVTAIDRLKIAMRKNAERDKLFRELVWQLYKDPEHVDFHKYFTDRMCQKIESKELELKHISPEKDWENWDVNNNDLCSFAFETPNTFLVILANKKKSDSLLDADKTRVVHSYYVVFVTDGDKLLIDDIKVQG